jgi:hypothetical protein
MSVSYVTRHGRRIEIETVDAGAIPFPRTKREPFKAQWVKLPLHWAETLRRSKRTSTYQLAHVILFEEFKQRAFTRKGEVVLSQAVVGMSQSAKKRAVKELVEFGLIKIVRNGRQALRAIPIYYFIREEKKKE